MLTIDEQQHWIEQVELGFGKQLYDDMNTPYLQDALKISQGLANKVKKFSR